MAETTTKKTKVTIRQNFGSFPVLIRVFAYDPSLGTVLARVKYPDNSTGICQYAQTELEAVDENRTYQDLKEHLRKRAEFIQQPD